MGTCIGVDYLDGDSDSYETVGCTTHSSYTFNLTAAWSTLAPSQAAANPPRALENISFMVQFALYVVGFSFTLLSAVTTIAITLGGMRIYVMDMVFKTVGGIFPRAVKDRGLLMLTIMAELLHLHICVRCLVDSRRSGLEAEKCVHAGRGDLFPWLHIGCFSRLDVDRHYLLTAYVGACNIRSLSGPSRRYEVQTGTISHSVLKYRVDLF